MYVFLLNSTNNILTQSITLLVVFGLVSCHNTISYTETSIGSRKGNPMLHNLWDQPTDLAHAGWYLKFPYFYKQQYETTV